MTVTCTTFTVKILSFAAFIDNAAIKAKNGGSEFRSAEEQMTYAVAMELTLPISAIFCINKRFRTEVACHVLFGVVVPTLETIEMIGGRARARKAAPAREI